MNRLPAIIRVFPRVGIERSALGTRRARSLETVAPSIAPASIRLYSSGHEDESFEAFTDRYVKYFENAEDLFDLQRGLNNCFAYDLVPAVPIIEAALNAARRMDDYSTAVRIFEGLKQKVENQQQYNLYLEELKPLKDKLGILTAEEMST
ncbi:1544_t:CDS:2 [Paraglomus occultum]|uniref:Cytochrome c oxidase subunit 6, mitochondrial n=1 Tax=Paraglomus occultum TaxID=144539 RepID=A0A9N9AMS4_9GLOM|nr:1544_t:CDS:2 [Paraglomus occultum]